MNIAYALILAVLAYIAYQLYKLNSGKEVEKEGEKLREKFPHLYSSASENGNKEIKSFLKLNEGDDLANYLYLERYKHINQMIETETDENKKKEMEVSKNTVVNELKQWENIFRKAMDKKEISSWEANYLVWRYLNGVNESFPSLYASVDAYAKSLGFGNLLNNHS